MRFVTVVTVQVWVIVAMESRCDDTKRTASICVHMRASCFDPLYHGYRQTKPDEPFFHFQTARSSLISLRRCRNTADGRPC
ncbi:hypothetical protein BJV78DRAFT_1186894 [Lactifluus subvellereus]|nr:hypothetical protein BJV78DRAFT_1186894 [Lactifluus subvellereus]